VIYLIEYGHTNTSNLWFLHYKSPVGILGPNWTGGGGVPTKLEEGSQPRGSDHFPIFSHLQYIIITFKQTNPKEMSLIGKNWQENNLFPISQIFSTRRGWTVSGNLHVVLSLRNSNTPNHMIIIPKIGKWSTQRFHKQLMLQILTVHVLSWYINIKIIQIRKIS
jgi:hypothetical protein